jgi:hypothetical protein
VLQAALSTLHCLQLRPVKLEFGDTILAHSLFLCGFHELQSHTVDKCALENKLQAHGFLNNLTLGEQEDATCFWANLTACGPLSEVARVWSDISITCGSCGVRTHDVETGQYHIQVPEQAIADELSPSRIASFLTQLVDGSHPCTLTPCFPRRCPSSLNPGGCQGEIGTRWDSLGRNQPACIAVRFALHRSRGGTERRSLMEVLPPSSLDLPTANGRYVLHAVVLHVGGSNSGHYTSVVGGPRILENPSSGISRSRCKSKCWQVDDISSSKRTWWSVLHANRRNIYMAIYVRADSLGSPVLVTRGPPTGFFDDAMAKIRIC